MPYRATGLSNVGFFHIVCRGNNRQDVFLNEDDFLHYRALLRKYEEKLSFKLHAYVLMGNHVHLLLEPSSSHSVSVVLHRMNLSFAHWSNKRYDRTGHLWEARFYALAIGDESYFLQCCRYIELNPVRAGIVADPADYPWSSHRGNSLGYPDDVLNSKLVVSLFGSNLEEGRRAYRSFILSDVKDEIDFSKIPPGVRSLGAGFSSREPA